MCVHTGDGGRYLELEQHQISSLAKMFPVNSIKFFHHVTIIAALCLHYESDKTMIHLREPW